MEPGEVCDDGNSLSGDGCRADCASDEVCGNGIVDIELGEACDCGADLEALPVGCTAVNGTGGCTSACLFAGCGDGELKAPESCEPTLSLEVGCVDVGFYGGELSCTNSCRFDSSGCEGFCGDGVVNGPEVCDGNSPASGCQGAGYSVGHVSCTDQCAASFARCSDVGWFRDVTDSSALLRGIWSAGKSAFAVGDDGTVLEFDSARWRESAFAIEQDLMAIHGRGYNDVVAVGAEGTIVRFDGTSWRNEVSPTRVALRSVWLPPSGGGYAVGERGVVIEYEGGAWREVTSPTSERLNGVVGDKNGALYVVGDGGALFVRHSDVWTRIDSGAVNDLYSLAPFEEGVWVVGAGGYAARLKGNVLTRLSTRTLRSLRAVDVLGEQAVAVGDGGLIVHLEDETATIVENASDSSLLGISLAEARSQLAVGADGTVLRSGGVSWVRSNEASGFRSVWVAKGAGMAVGADGVWQRIGEDWFPITGAGQNLIAVDASTDATGRIDAALVVGEHGGIRRFDGARWSEESTPTEETLFDVLILSDSSACAIGAKGTVLEFDGRWSTIDTGIAADLRSVARSDSGNLVVVGDAATVLEKIDEAWERVEIPGLPATVALHDAAFLGETLFIAGDGVVAVRERRGWTVHTVPRTIKRLEVFRGELIGAATSGSLFRFRGNTWRQYFDSEGHLGMKDVATDGARLYAVGARNVFEYQGGDWLRALESPRLDFVKFSRRGDAGPIYAVASYGRWQGPNRPTWLYRFVDGRWTEMPNTPESVVDLLDASTPTDERVYAVAKRALYLFEGASNTWRLVSSFDEDVSLRSLTLFDGETVLAAGETAETGLVIRYRQGDSDVWSYHSAPLVAVHAVEGRVFALDSDGQAISWSSPGTSTSLGLPIAPGDNLESMWASGTDDLWIAGGSAFFSVVMFHFDGREWTRHFHSAANELTAGESSIGSVEASWTVHGTSSSDLFFQGFFRSSLFHWNGARWERFASPEWDAPDRPTVFATPRQIFFSNRRRLLRMVQF